MESDTIASNRSRLVQIAEGLYQHNGLGEYYARFWCKGKRIQQELGTTERPCITLAEARRLFRDLKHSAEHIVTSKSDKVIKNCFSPHSEARARGIVGGRAK